MLFIIAWMKIKLSTSRNCFLIGMGIITFSHITICNQKYITISSHNWFLLFRSHLVTMSLWVFLWPFINVSSSLLLYPPVTIFKCRYRDQTKYIAISLQEPYHHPCFLLEHSYHNYICLHVMMYI